MELCDGSMWEDRLCLCAPANEPIQEDPGLTFLLAGDLESVSIPTVTARSPRPFSGLPAKKWKSFSTELFWYWGQAAGNDPSVSAGEVLAYCFPSDGGGLCTWTWGEQTGRTEIVRTFPAERHGFNLTKVQPSKLGLHSLHTCSSFSPLLIKR